MIWLFSKLKVSSLLYFYKIVGVDQRDDSERSLVSGLGRTGGKVHSFQVTHFRQLPDPSTTGKNHRGLRECGIKYVVYKAIVLPRQIYVGLVSEIMEFSLSKYSANSTGPWGIRISDQRLCHGSIGLPSTHRRGREDSHSRQRSKATGFIFEGNRNNDADWTTPEHR